MPLIEVILP